jgi:hypothetical protein
MLNPLDALSLTSTIVQFIDFTSQVVAKTKEIYESGTDLESTRLKSQARDLKGLSEDLARRDKLRKIIPAEELTRRDKLHKLPPADESPSNVGQQPRSLQTMGDLDMVLVAAKREKKFRKATQELDEVEARLETRERLGGVDQVGFPQREERLHASTDVLFQLYDGLKGREMSQLYSAGHLAKGEEVSLPSTPYPSL